MDSPKGFLGDLYIGSMKSSPSPPNQIWLLTPQVFESFVFYNFMIKWVSDKNLHWHPELQSCCLGTYSKHSRNKVLGHFIFFSYADFSIQFVAFHMSVRWQPKPAGHYPKQYLSTTLLVVFRSTVIYSHTKKFSLGLNISLYFFFWTCITNIPRNLYPKEIMWEGHVILKPFYFSEYFPVFEWLKPHA